MGSMRVSSGLALLSCLAIFAFQKPLRADSIITTGSSVEVAWSGAPGANDVTYPYCSTCIASKYATGAQSSQVFETLSSPQTIGPNNYTATGEVNAGYYHVGLDFNAAGGGTSARGSAYTAGSGYFLDEVTVYSETLDPGELVTLNAVVGLESTFNTVTPPGGAGSFDISACMTIGSGYSAPSGCAESYESTLPGKSQPLHPPYTVTFQFQAPVDEPFQVAGNLSGEVYAQEGANWTIAADNSAHFSIVPVDPTQDLIVQSQSGCNAQNGWGCDTPISAVPEPPSLALLGTGLLSGGAFLWWRRGWFGDPEAVS